MIKARLLALLLVTVMLLSACVTNNPDETENTTPSTTQTQTTAPTTITTQPTEPPIPTVDEVINCTYTTEGGIDGFSDFYYIFKQTWDQEDSDSISITRTNTDGTKTVIELSGRTGNDFKYKVGDTTLTFPYLVYCQHPGTKEDNFEYLEYFLLANDPNATYLDTLEENGATAVIVYAEYLNRTVSRAESYGEVPEGVQALAELTNVPIGVPYLQDSIFMETPDGTLKRYNYEGNLLSSLDALPNGKKYTDSAELPDGGFILDVQVDAPTEDNPSFRYISIICYDKDGNQRWEYTPVDEDGTPNVSSFRLICVHNNTIYLVSTDITKLSLDGDVIGHKEFVSPSFHRFIPIENGFEVYIDAGEGDPDFPISEDGNDHIKAILDFDSNIVSISYVDEWPVAGSLAGILGDDYIYVDDPILEPTEKDILPSDAVATNNLFDIDDGYVLVHKHLLDKCHMWRASGLFENFYHEVIFTGYDNDGNPLWQTTSLINAPLYPSYTTTNG